MRSDIKPGSSSLELFNLCSYNVGGGPHTRPLPPPPEVIEHDNAVKSIPHMTNSKPVQPTAPEASVEPVPFPLNFSSFQIRIYTRFRSDIQVMLFQVCPICLTDPKDLAFGCGHLVSAFPLQLHHTSMTIFAGDCVFTFLLFLQ